MTDFVETRRIESKSAISFIPLAGCDVSMIQRKTTIVGIPSESGLGQIAVEAIYHALSPSEKIQRVGFLHSDLFIPISGYMKESNGEQVLLHPAEVFWSSEQQLVFVLLRSSCLPGREIVFAEELIRFLALRIEPSQTILLSGASRDNWDLNPYQRHLFSIHSEHSKALVESSFPGLFAMYDGSDAVNIRLSLSLFAKSNTANTNNDDNTTLNSSSDNSANHEGIWSEAAGFLRQPGHPLNQSDLTFPLGMSLTVAILFQVFFADTLHFHPVSTPSAIATSTTSDTTMQHMKESLAVYGLFENVGSPIFCAVQWAADLLVSFSLVQETTSSLSQGAKAEEIEEETDVNELKEGNVTNLQKAQKLLQMHLPSLWRDILMESM